MHVQLIGIKSDTHPGFILFSVTVKFNTVITFSKQNDGLNRDLNPGPPAPKAGIIPLDH
jgi:hypothetical protein